MFLIYIIYFIILSIIATIWSVNTGNFLHSSDKVIEAQVIHENILGNSLVTNNKKKRGQPKNTPLPSSIKKIYDSTRILIPLAVPLGAAKHDKDFLLWGEQDQSFQEYAQYKKRRKITNIRNVILIQPLGDLTVHDENAIKVIGDILEACYGVKIKVNTPIKLERIPDNLYKKNKKELQVSADKFLDNYLPSKVKDNAVSIIAYTKKDLWPGERDYGIAGLGSFYKRTAIMSLNLMLRPNEVADDKRPLRDLCLLAVHEIGHTFTMFHCNIYECIMNAGGSYSDLLFCPDCLAKVILATGKDLEKHCQDMYDFSKKNDFKNEINYYSKALEVLKSSKNKK